MTGFHVCDDYGEQQLIAHDAVLWCDKRGSRWRAADFESPPPKSKLLAAEPNEHPSTDRRMDWQPDYPENDEKPLAPGVTDWRKS
jgi:hypothetical protein